MVVVAAVAVVLARRLQLLRVLEDLEPLLRHPVSVVVVAAVVVVLEHLHQLLRVLVPLLVALVLLPLTRRPLERPPRLLREVSLERLQQHLREVFSVHQHLLRADSARRLLVQDLEASVRRRRRHLLDSEEVLLLELRRQHRRVASLGLQLQQLVALEALDRQLPLLLDLEHLHQRHKVEAFLEHLQRHRHQRGVCSVPQRVPQRPEEVALKRHPFKSQRDKMVLLALYYRR
jgi:hypothetical protein